MGKCIGWITQGNFVFFFIENGLGELTHKATTHPFSNHGSWSKWMSDMLIDTMTMAVLMAVRVTMIVAMRVLMAVPVIMRVLMVMFMAL